MRSLARLDPLAAPARRTRRPRWAPALLAALLMVLIATLGTASASAATVSVAETRVGASNIAGQVAVGPSASITAGQRLGNSRPRAEVVVATGVAAEGALPELSASRAALEAKFKHAADFGVTEGQGAAGFDSFGKAIDSFVQDSSTTRIVGTYRGDPAILNYNANTAQVVVQGTDGTFISGWQMSPAQLQNVIERGSLGGG
jgi:hypothetical protein